MRVDITVARFAGLVAGDLTTADLVFLNETQIDALAESQGPDGPVVPDHGDDTPGGDDSTGGGDDTTGGGDDTPPALTGTEGDDVLFGSFDDDLIEGLDGNDKLIGDDGDDTLIGGLGDDTYYAGDGHDVVRDTAEGIFCGNNEVYGNAGNDILEVSHGRFSDLYGGEGDDILISDQTITDMTGGEGADYFLPADTPNGILPRPTYATVQDFTPGEDKVVIRLFGDETEDDFTLVARENGDAAVLRTLTPLITETVVVLNGVSLEELSEDDIIFVTDAQAEAFVASQGADGPDATLLTGDGGGGDDTTDGNAITGTEGDDRIIGTYEDDEILGFGGNDFLAGDDGSDTIDADDGRDTVYGGDGNDLIRTEGAENELFGNDGADILWATEAAVMTGGDGTDYYVPGSAESVVTDFELGTDRIVVPLAAGETAADYSLTYDADADSTMLMRGADIVMRLQGVPQGALVDGDITFLDQTAFEAFLNSQGSDGPSLPDGPAPDGPTEGNDTLIGTDGNDTIDGLGGDDLIQGGTGMDSLLGGDGNDTLEVSGGLGGDTLIGGAGDDLLDHGFGPYYFNPNGSAPSLLDGGDGNDTLDAYFNATLIGGAGDDVLSTSYGVGVEIDGGAGDDTLVGGLFNTSMYGGEGDDVLRMGGSDTFTGVRYGFGGAGDDRISGGTFGGSRLVLDGEDGDDTLRGGHNLDTLIGGTGNDVLDGALGADELEGGEGSDAFVIRTFDVDRGLAPGTDSITDFTPGVDTLVLVHPDGAPVSSSDLVYQSDTGDLTVQANLGSGAAVDVVTLVGISGPDQLVDGDILILSETEFAELELPERAITGTEGDDTLTGTEAANAINGLGGNDIIDGLGGDDVIDGGAGVDTLDGGTGNDFLFAGEDTETGGLTPGGLSAQDVDLVRGGDGDDTIVGDIRNLTALGEAGNDLILGGEDGVQRLVGGDGNDTIVGGTATPTQGLYTPNGLSVIDGGNGADVLVDGTGFIMTGGTGADTFIADSSTRISDFDPAEDALLLTYAGETHPDAFEVSVLNQTKFFRLMHLGYDLRLTITATDGSDQSWTVLLVDDGVQLGPNPFDDFPGTQGQIDAWTSRISFISTDEVAALTATTA